MKGAGSLAHEWGHALDSYLAESGDFFATDRSDGILADVVQTMKYKETDGRRMETDFYKDAKKLDGNFSAMVLIYHKLRKLHRINQINRKSEAILRDEK